MKILFVHQNTPGQYKHLARRLAADPANQVAFIGKVQRPIPNVGIITYKPARDPGSSVHPYIHMLEGQILHGQGAVRAGLALQQRGFVPEVICAHPGWGEALFLKDVFPDAKLLNYCEFFYRADGSDVGFDPDRPVSLDLRCRIRMKNAALLTSLEAADWGIAPTEWQHRQHPQPYRSRISIIHDGVDTDLCRPDEEATVTLSDGRVLTRRDEVVTYIARNLEPYRGFPTFMRAAEEILRRRPGARILVVGGDEVSYGSAPPDAANWREKMLREVSPDPDRLHFLGKVPYDQFLRIVQLSRAHIYLTYPFVLSWSLLEAMACGALVVGSATPPVEEVIADGCNGLLTGFFDAPALAARVVEALERTEDDPAGTAALREAARRTVVERFDLNRVCLPAQLRLIEDLRAGRTPQAGTAGTAASGVTGGY